jgi:hypothetical protein
MPRFFQCILAHLILGVYFPASISLLIGCFLICSLTCSFLTPLPQGAPARAGGEIPHGSGPSALPSSGVQQPTPAVTLLASKLRDWIPSPLSLPPPLRTFAPCVFFQFLSAHRPDSPPSGAQERDSVPAPRASTLPFYGLIFLYLLCPTAFTRQVLLTDPPSGPCPQITTTTARTSGTRTSALHRIHSPSSSGFSGFDFTAHCLLSLSVPCHFRP